MSLHTIFFDLDGTLTDSAPGILACVRHALDKMSIPAGDGVTAQNFIGPPLSSTFARVYGLEGEANRQAVAYFRERFSTVGLFENSVYPGIHAALQTLQDAGMRLVLATSKPEIYTVRILAHFNLTKYFDQVAGALLDGSRDEKPDVLRHAMQLCGLLDGAGCAMVGDRATDITSGHGCGMLGVGVLYGGGSLEELQGAGADALAETPAELAPLLLNL